MNRPILSLLLLFLLGLGLKPAHAQYIPGKLSERATISILTVGPGEPVYTLFGHTAIRLQDPASHIDQVYNYGTFNFDTPDFYLTFLYGDLDYYLSIERFAQFKQANIALGRSIVSQTLDLSPTKLNALVKTLEQNSLPKHRSYQYRFFGQNCVTQVRDLVSDQYIWPSSGRIEASALSTPTYRQKLGVYLTNRPWIQLGVNLLLGEQADQPLTHWEQLFLPNALHLFLANATDTSGKQLVKSSQTIAKAQMIPSEQTLPPVIVLWVLLVIVAFVTAVSLARGWQGWWLDRILFGAVGMLGLILAFGSLVSLHQPLHYNWNLLWALPTHLLVAAKVQSFSRNKWLRSYFGITIALNGAVLVAGPALPQQLPAAIMPFIAGITIRSAYRLYVAKQSEAPNSAASKSSLIESINQTPSR